MHTELSIIAFQESLLKKSNNTNFIRSSLLHPAEFVNISVTSHMVCEA